jgi:hypothetical protein
LQPITELNSNMLMAESLCFITLSMYFMYRILKDESIENIFRHPHFQVAIICLVLWACTIFFWAFILVLYQSHWKYLGKVISVQITVDMLIYIGYAATLYFYKPGCTINEIH